MNRPGIKPRYHFLRAFLPVCALLLVHTTNARADFSGEFEEAEKAAGKLTPEQNTQGEVAAESLALGGQVKTVADWVGVSATAATIGTELYDWVAVDDKKLAKLDEEYRTALANENNERAEEVLKQIQEINANKSSKAKSQADTQNSLKTIQNVAGYANLGAATGSLFSAFQGYNAASKLKSGVLEDPKRTQSAVKKAKSAASTALIYGAGEAAAGILSLHLASKHGDRAKDLESLADDPESDLPTDISFDLDALFDSVAVTKCGSGSEYSVRSVSEAAESYTAEPETNRVAGEATTDDVQYASVYNRINCIETPNTVADGSGSDSDGGTTTTDNMSNGGLTADTANDGLVTCTSEVSACPDGSFVNRDPNNRCQFFACPSSTTTADASTVTERNLTSSGASRLQMDDVGAEIENNPTTDLFDSL